MAKSQALQLNVDTDEAVEEKDMLPQAPVEMKEQHIREFGLVLHYVRKVISHISYYNDSTYCFRP